MRELTGGTVRMPLRAVDCAREPRVPRLREAIRFAYRLASLGMTETNNLLAEDVFYFA